MSNDLVIMQQKDIDIAGKLGIDIDIYRALRYSLFPDRSVPEYAFGLYMAACKAKNYDPLKKPYHIVMINVNINDNKKAEPVWEKHPTIMPGIISYRIDASRTGTFLGMSETEYGPIITKKFVEKTVSYPEWAKVIIYKLVGERVVEIPAKLYWEECYAAAKKGSTIPNDMWSKRPRAQLEKCVHAHALRLGFSEEIGGVMTHEEMEGRQSMDDLPVEKDITPEKKQIEQVPLSQSFTVNEEELFKHIDTINNCETSDTLKSAYMEAMKFSKGDKLAVNKVVETKNERKKYLDQVAKVLKENPPPTQDNKEWLDAYDSGEKKL